MLGPSLSYSQILKIKKKDPSEIYIIPDNDPTGRKKIVNNVSSLRMFLKCPIYIVKWWTQNDAKDPIDGRMTFNDLLKCDIVKTDRSLDLRVKLGFFNEQ